MTTEDQTNRLPDQTHSTPPCAICCRPAGEAHDMPLHRAVAVEALERVISRTLGTRCPICTYSSCGESHRRIAAEALRLATERR